MVFSELNCVNMSLEIEDLLENGGISNQRLVNLLNDVLLENKAIDTVNMHILKYKAGELSEKDLMIAINRFKTAKKSVVD